MSVILNELLEVLEMHCLMNFNKITIKTKNDSSRKFSKCVQGELLNRLNNINKISGRILLSTPDKSEFCQKKK